MAHAHARACARARTCAVHNQECARRPRLRAHDVWAASSGAGGMHMREPGTHTTTGVHAAIEGVIGIHYEGGSGYIEIGDSEAVWLDDVLAMDANMDESGQRYLCTGETTTEWISGRCPKMSQSIIA